MRVGSSQSCDTRVAVISKGWPLTTSRDARLTSVTFRRELSSVTSKVTFPSPTVAVTQVRIPTSWGTSNHSPPQQKAG